MDLQPDRVEPAFGVTTSLKVRCFRPNVVLPVLTGVGGACWNRWQAF